MKYAPISILLGIFGLIALLFPYLIYEVIFLKAIFAGLFGYLAIHFGNKAKKQVEPYSVISVAIGWVVLILAMIFVIALILYYFTMLI
jgi:hypothetical protein